MGEDSAASQRAQAGPELREWSTDDLGQPGVPGLSGKRPGQGPKDGQRGSRLAHLSLLEQNVTARVGSAGGVGKDLASGDSLRSLTRPPRAVIGPL